MLRRSLGVGAVVALCACGDSGPAAGGGAGGGPTSGGGGEGGSPPVCASADECPQPVFECQVAVCESSVCGIAPVAMGVPTATQTLGDCSEVQCDGAGSTQTVDDDDDLPNDLNACTSNTCELGEPLSTLLAVGTPCSEQGVCDGAGMCVLCLGNQDCGVATECSTPTCFDGGCITEHTAAGTPIALQTSGDCQQVVCDGNGSTSPENLDSDSFDDGNSCTTDACASGVPTHTAQPGQPCGTNGTCDAAGQCVGCLAPVDCPGTDDFCRTRTCSPAGVCGFDFTPDGTALPAASQTVGDCVTLACQGGVSQPSVTPTDVPVDGFECTLDVCNGAMPDNPAVSAGTSCNSMGGALCDGFGSCVDCLLPSDCGTPPGAPCVVPTCSMGSCGTANASASTPCGAASCSGGVATNPDMCNGAGSCIDAGTTSCGAYACGPSACLTSCATDAGCQAPATCDEDLGICTTNPHCTDYCDTIQAACTGGLSQYPSQAACLEACQALPPGTLADGSGNTVGCRLYHATVAGSAPNPHCYHAGPGGAGVCGSDCAGFCDIAQFSCTAGNSQYASEAACLSECAGFPASPPYSTAVVSGDSLACRMYHLMVATEFPAAHCSHIIESSTTCN